MQTNYSDLEINGPMTQERRKRKRYKIDCPVTVLTPGRGKKRTLGSGWLDDISDHGARFHLDHPLATGDRISLVVHFSVPSGEVTDIRFRAVVKRVSHVASYDTAVSFLKGESYLRHDGSRGKGLSRLQMGDSGRWIN